MLIRTYFLATVRYVTFLMVCLNTHTNIECLHPVFIPKILHPLWHSCAYPNAIKRSSLVTGAVAVGIQTKPAISCKLWHTRRPKTNPHVKSMTMNAKNSLWSVWDYKAPLWEVGRNWWPQGKKRFNAPGNWKHWFCMPTTSKLLLCCKCFGYFQFLSLQDAPFAIIKKKKNPHM